MNIPQIARSNAIYVHHGTPHGYWRSGISQVAPAGHHDGVAKSGRRCRRTKAQDISRVLKSDGEAINRPAMRRERVTFATAELRSGRRIYFPGARHLCPPRKMGGDRQRDD